MTWSFFGRSHKVLGPKGPQPIACCSDSINPPLEVLLPSLDVKNYVTHLLVGQVCLPAKGRHGEASAILFRIGCPTIPDYAQHSPRSA